MLDGHPNLFVYPSNPRSARARKRLPHLLRTHPLSLARVSVDVAPAQAYEMFWDEELKTLLRVPWRSKFRMAACR